MVLLVIDVQKQITTNELYCYEKFIENQKMLIDAARSNGVEVIYVRHDDGEGKPLTKGTDGFEIFGEVSPNADEKVFDKLVNSPFKESGLLEYLREKQISRVIVSGLQTEYCIDATVKCGFEHGFEVIVPQHSNSTFDNAFMTAEQTYRYYNEFIWDKRYAKSLSVAETIDMMKQR